MASLLSSRTLALVFALSALALPQAQTQPQPQPRAQPPAQRATEADATEVRAIVVDVVVRDARGNPITDLTAQDFELTEDGARQDIGSFTAVVGEPPAQTRRAATKPATPAAPEAASKAPEVMAFVFDRLTPDGRAFATKAALGYVGDGAVANNIIAVFGIDLSLIFYQPFTRDSGLIRKGVDAAAGQATSQFGNSRGTQAALAEQAVRAAQAVQQATAGAGGPGAATPNVAGAASDAQFSAMQSRMQERFQALERDQQGYATSNALMAIVSAMKAIPGRKSVVFFSEGLSIPSNVQRQFISVIDAANRANVSIYPMDAAGLRTDSTLQESKEGIGAASAAMLNRDPTRDVSDRPMMQALETNEDLLRADPHSGLGMLAEQTGGFLIANSNNLRDGFSRIDTDMRNYYVLTYVPTNATFDGRFREIGVKVKRSGARVRARKGYYAVRTTVSGAPILGYEAPALAVLEQSPLPNAFPARAAVLRFPEASRTGLVPVLVNVPMSGITFRPAPDKKTYTSDFIVLVQFKDEAGQVLDKMSQRYQLNGPIEQIDRAPAGDVLFYREPVLIPGVFTMEAVVHDALAGKSTVRVLTVDVPDLDPKALRLSSVVAIKRSEKMPANERVEGPLYVGDQLLYPSMGEPLSKAAVKELPFYFVVYPADGGGAPTATIELLNNGQLLAKAPLQLAAPDPTGHIKQVSRIPIEALTAGAYELKVSVQQGSQTASRALSFRVAP
jgi:VWFA-related protein